MANGEDKRWEKWALQFLGSLVLAGLGTLFGWSLGESEIEAVRTRHMEHEAMVAHPVSLEAQTAHRREADRRFEDVDRRLARIETKLDEVLRRVGP